MLKGEPFWVANSKWRSCGGRARGVEGPAIPREFEYNPYSSLDPPTVSLDSFCLGWETQRCVLAGKGDVDGGGNQIPVDGADIEIEMQTPSKKSHMSLIKCTKINLTLYFAEPISRLGNPVEELGDPELAMGVTPLRGNTANTKG
ncbi:hypothetical protein VNO80_16205 [Phaseolus coccineus]|uniref:Uncharacterized protein n=1 Tax=Phaseolus coccineus TaxID=3886 RepID=A0AAN9MLA8_PHACN